MMPPMRPPVLLLAALLLAGGAVAAEAAAGSALLDQAQQLQLVRRLREAIPLYRAVIERDRDDLGLALPALRGLVDCHRALAGDPATATAYPALIGRYLARIPPLDGDGFDEDAAAQDLLWRPWDGAPSRFRLRVERTRRQGDGSALLMLAVTGSPLVRVVAGQAPIPVEATAPDGSLLTLQGLAMGPDGLVTALLPDAPAGALRLTAIRATLPLSLPRETIRQEVALAQGRGWRIGATTGTVREVRSLDGEWTVVLRIEGPEAGSWLPASARPPWEPAAAPGHGPGWTLRTGAGDEVAVVSSRMQGDGRTSSITLVTAPGAMPELLVVQAPGRLSLRNEQLTASEAFIP